ATTCQSRPRLRANNRRLPGQLRYGGRYRFRVGAAPGGLPRRFNMKSTPLVPKIRVLIGAVVAIGPGKADLLQAIARTGSISAAAREMRMSYRRAWLLVESMNA